VRKGEKILMLCELQELTEIFFFFFNLWDGTLGTAATYWPIVPASDDR
jgi:hypothetical protein